MREILLSGHDGGPAWTVAARPILEGPGWAGVERALAAGLDALRERTGRDGVAWAGMSMGVESTRVGVELVSMWLTFDLTDVGDDDLTAIDVAIRGAAPDALYEGYQPLEEPCVPVLGTDEGELHRAWLTDGDDLVSGVLAWGDDDGVTIIGLEAHDERPDGSLALPDLVIHLAGADDALAPVADDPVDRLRSALLFDAALRLHDAADKDPSVGRALVVRLGPLLLAHGLLTESGGVDYEALGEAASEAVAVLPDALDEASKQAIVDELRAVASAGGGVTPAQAEVIAKVAALLGLA